MNTQTGAVFDTASGKVGGDAFTTYLVAVDVVVVGPVGVQAVWSPAWTAAFAAYRRDGLDQREELSDVVSVAAGQGDGQWDARAFGDDMVFRAGLGTVDRARAGFGPPFKARTCEPSITALDQSNLSAALSSASSSSCRRCQTPAGATGPTGASRSSRSRTPTPAAGTPTESRCTARTGCRTAPAGPVPVCVPGCENAAGVGVTAVRSAPTAHPAPSMVAARPSAQLPTVGHRPQWTKDPRSFC